jgi:hypothetical protein
MAAAAARTLACGAGGGYLRDVEVGVGGLEEQQTDAWGDA